MGQRLGNRVEAVGVRRLHAGNEGAADDGAVGPRGVQGVQVFGSRYAEADGNGRCAQLAQVGDGGRQAGEAAGGVVPVRP